MAEQSGFFNAHLIDGEYDRIYQAEDFAKYFASFIGNGVFGGKLDELMVQQKATADMSIKVLSGQAWINGYWYTNNDDISLSIDIADGILNRVDLIVLKWDNIERKIRLGVKKGIAASDAAAPTLQRNADYYELALAQINIRAGATNITQADIIDTRFDKALCGLVTNVVQPDEEEVRELIINLENRVNALSNSLDNHLTIAPDFSAYPALINENIISGVENLGGYYIGKVDMGDNWIIQIPLFYVDSTIKDKYITMMYLLAIVEGVAYYLVVNSYHASSPTRTSSIIFQVVTLKPDGTTAEAYPNKVDLYLHRISEII